MKSKLTWVVGLVRLREGKKKVNRGYDMSSEGNRREWQVQKLLLQGQEQYRKRKQGDEASKKRSWVTRSKERELHATAWPTGDTLRESAVQKRNRKMENG